VKFLLAVLGIIIFLLVLAAMEIAFDVYLKRKHLKLVECKPKAPKITETKHIDIAI